MDFGLQGRTAMVCGASRGIGFAAALSLAREGARPTLVARTARTLEEAAARIAAETGRPCDYIAANLADPGDRARLIEQMPPADILVTHPGIPQRSRDFLALDRAELDWWMEAHYYSAIELIRAALPGMTGRGFGRIVNISVNFIKFPQTRVGHSHAARLALAGAIASLVREVAPRNVTINSILPGLIDTEALRAAFAERAETRGVSADAVAGEATRLCPAQRIADPKEVGDLVAMLAAAQAGFITGQNIAIDGGAYQGLF